MRLSFRYCRKNQSIVKDITIDAKSTDKKNKNPGCLVIIVVFLLLILIDSTGNNKTNNSTETNQDSTNITSNTIKSADISDFDYSINSDSVSLTSYNGKDKILMIDCTYDIDGNIYQTDLTNFQIGIGNSKVKTLILSEGITEVMTAIFNSSDVKAVYFPKSMTNVYDYTLSYLHPENGEKIQIYYGGTKEDWDKIFTHYERQTLKDAIENGTASDIGASVADKLNEFAGSGLDYSEFEFHYSANPLEIM